MPLCSGALNLTALAEAAGYKEVITADSEASLRDALKKAVSLPGPLFLVIRCACGARSDLGRPTTSPIQNRNSFMNYLKNG